MQCFNMHPLLALRNYSERHFLCNFICLDSYVFDLWVSYIFQINIVIPSISAESIYIFRSASYLYWKIIRRIFVLTIRYLLREDAVISTIAEYQRQSQALFSRFCNSTAGRIRHGNLLNDTNSVRDSVSRRRRRYYVVTVGAGAGRCSRKSIKWRETRIRVPRMSIARARFLSSGDSMSNLNVSFFFLCNFIRDIHLRARRISSSRTQHGDA